MSASAAMVIRLAPGVLEAVRGHARRAYPHECCGALVGRAAEQAGGGGLVVRTVPLENAERVAPGLGYSIPAAVVWRVQRDAAQEGLELVGFYHSHPDGAPEPSGVDRENAWPWYNYLIVAVADGEPGDVRVWRLAEDRSRFDAVAIVVEDGG
ncbi:MAG TPA: M67 family metallopeptidase [Longimicrobiales bacterium]